MYVRMCRLCTRKNEMHTYPEEEEEEEEEEKEKEEEEEEEEESLPACSNSVASKPDSVRKRTKPPRCNDDGQQ